MSASAFPKSVDGMIELLTSRGYLAERSLATVAYLSLRMGRPLFLEGEAGVGKTEIAKVLSAALGRKLIRLQCYEGLDESKALYEWEYSKQLLYTQMLRDKIGEIASTVSPAAGSTGGAADAFLAAREGLVGLGFSSDEAEAALSDAPDGAEAEVLIRHALGRLRR